VVGSVVVRHGLLVLQDEADGEIFPVGVLVLEGLLHDLHGVADGEVPRHVRRGGLVAGREIACKPGRHGVFVGAPVIRVVEVVYERVGPQPAVDRVVQALVAWFDDVDEHGELSVSGAHRDVVYFVRVRRRNLVVHLVDAQDVLPQTFVSAEFLDRRENVGRLAASVGSFHVHEHVSTAGLQYPYVVLVGRCFGGAVRRSVRIDDPLLVALDRGAGLAIGGSLVVLLCRRRLGGLFGGCHG